MIYRMKFRNKLILLIAFPIAGLLFFSQAWIVEQFSRVDDMRSLSRMADLSISIGDLIHETQKERGMTSGFLGASGEAFADSLSTQRMNTDSRAERLKGKIISLEMHEQGDDISKDIKAFENKFNNLSSVRARVIERQITSEEAIDYYTSLNSALFKVIEYLTQMSANPELVKSSAAYISLLQGKERAGLERAVLSNAFSNDAFDEGGLLRFNTLVAVQDTYFSVFMSLAALEHRNYFRNRMNAPVVAEVQRMRDIALSRAGAGGLGVDAKEWSNVITDKINLLKEMEDMLAVDIAETADALLRTAYNALIIDFAITLVALFAVLFFSFYITRDILNQLGGEPLVIVEASKRISAGDLNMHLNIEAKSGSLYSEMQHMAEALKLDIMKIIEAADSVQKCSQKIQVNMHKLSQEASGQVSVADQVASATTELSHAVLDIAQNSSNIAEAATETMNVAEDGAKVVESTVSEVQAISETMDESSLLMSSLGDRSNQIGEIIGVINDIADQTNLLALNAAIEAARAGEQGRGFAVVADEVRKLAERTSKATGEISQMITSMQDETGRAISSMDDSIKKVETGTDLSRQAGEALKKIMEHVSDLHAKVQQIAAATEEMSSTSDVITEDISSIAKAAHTTNSSALKTTGETEYLARLSDELKAITSHFKID
ncbi:MAG TPA: hypothetical protein ENI12_03485, partial [Nitrospirae bacterium]|nr:hypothetical protein [Nitrospirota bacterium]